MPDDRMKHQTKYTRLGTSSLSCVGDLGHGQLCEGRDIWSDDER